MPMPGDQHRDTAATTNPFAEQKPIIAEYTAQEIATLQSKLDKQLGPEYISTRPGQGGGKVHYLAAEKVINLANEVFGFNGWSSAIQNVQIDFVDEHAQTGKISLGLSTIVRVTLRDGTYHEDIGYGHIENCKGKAAAFEKAKKEAATDAMKRALRNFGNVLGNCLYDKDYLQKVTKVKIAPTRWDAENLHRHPDYAPIKREALGGVQQTPASEKNSVARRQISVQSGASFGSTEFDDDFGGNPFDETDISHPDEVRLEDSMVGQNSAMGNDKQRQSTPRTNSLPPIRLPNIQPPPPISIPHAPQKPQGPLRPPNITSQAPPARQFPGPAAANHSRPSAATTNTAQNQPSLAGGTDSAASHVQHHRQLDGAASNEQEGELADELNLPIPRQPPPDAPQGFVTGRSVDLLNQPPSSRPPNAVLAFNPHAETPSIRRTHGVNPGKSAPVLRQAVGGAPAAIGNQPAHAPSVPGGPPQPPQQLQSNGVNGIAAPVRANFVNPSADMNRRIGMPPSAASHTVQNRTPYKAPTSAKRPPLSDISNMQQTDGPGDTKKARVEQPEEGDNAAQEVVVAPGPTA